MPKALDASVDGVVSSAVDAKGGTTLRVPKVIASMETWQVPESNNVDFVVKSLFDGKIDVGWNLSRINFVKDRYTIHDRPWPPVSASLSRSLRSKSKPVPRMSRKVDHHLRRLSPHKRRSLLKSTCRSQV